MGRLRSFLDEFDTADILAGWPLSALMATCVLLHWRFVPKLGRLLPVVYDGIYMLVPIAFVCALASRGLLSRLAFAVVLALVAVPLIWAKTQGLPKDWAIANPPRVVVPAAIAAVVTLASALHSRPRLDDWLLGPGDWRWWGPKLGIAMLVVLPGAALAVLLSPSLQAYYPSEAAARGSLPQLFLNQLSRGGHLLGEELFWHGIMLGGLARLYGRSAAVVITSFGYFVLHKGKPELEMASSFPGAMILGVISLRCRSFWPAFLGHWPMNAAVELTAFGLAGPR
jgi:membrane protease YdiL (CAAX protease family)